MFINFQPIHCIMNGKQTSRPNIIFFWNRYTSRQCSSRCFQRPLTRWLSILAPYSLPCSSHPIHWQIVRWRIADSNMRWLNPLRDCLQCPFFPWLWTWQMQWRRCRGGGRTGPDSTAGSSRPPSQQSCHARSRERRTSADRRSSCWSSQKVHYSTRPFCKEEVNRTARK